VVIVRLERAREDVMAKVLVFEARNETAAIFRVVAEAGIVYVLFATVMVVAVVEDLENVSVAA